MALFCRRIFLSFFIIIIVFKAQSQAVPQLGKPVTLEHTEQFNLVSKNVPGENYLIQVSLPVNYDSYGFSFPVLYVLDGDKSFGMTKDIADWLMWFSEIRDIIVVGISYGQGVDAWWEKRERDYTHSDDTVNAKNSVNRTGGADYFLGFIKNELFPVINKKYRTLKDRNTIMGISYGGMLGSYTLFTQPDMFKNYILIGPTLVWDSESILRIESAYSKEHRMLNKTVYIAYGSNDSKGWVISSTSNFIKNIQLHNYDSLKLIPQVIDGETHISAYSTALTHGLKVVFGR